MDLFRDAIKEYYSEKAPTSLQQHHRDTRLSSYMHRMWGNFTRAYSHL